MSPEKKGLSLVFVDDPVVPEGVVVLIRAQSDFHVLAASAEIEAVLQQTRRTRPDIVLLNVRQAGDDRLTLAGALHGVVPESRVIVMGVEPTHVDVWSFIRAGVSGFIMADASFDQVLGTIHSVALGIRVLPSALTRPLFRQLDRHGVRRSPARTLGGRRLTGWEREVVDLIVRGVDNGEIAARLGIAPRTVKSHVHRVLSELPVGSQLTVAAFVLH